MREMRGKRSVAAVVAAILLIGCALAGCGTGPAADDAAVGDSAADSCETCEAAKSDLPPSFTNLAAGVTPAQSADEETHIQTNVLDLGGVETVGYFRILWPDLDVQQYIIESSTDGETYETLYTNDRGPYFAEDETALDVAVQARYIRLSGIAASALPVPEVYAEDPWDDVEEALSVELVQDDDGRTVLTLAGLPDGIEASYGGCDYEEVIAAIGDDAGLLTEDIGDAAADAMAVVMDTIEDKTVQVGFALSAETAAGTWTHDTGDYTVEVPAQDRQGTSADLKEDSEEAAALGFNARPAVIPSLQEWQGGKGTVTLPVEDVEWINAASLTDTADGRIVYELVEDAGLGEEGYRIDIGCSSAADADSIRVYAQTETGLRWGNVTLRQMIVLAGERAGGDTAGNDDIGVDVGDGDITSTDADRTSGGEAGSNDLAAVVQLPRSRIRDYPVGSVRGIMLDVGRNTMSLSQIEQIARNLSWFKMNELTLHLQDNALLTYSDKTDTVENARTAYSAFRMESEIMGEDGETITAEDLSYTAEEFAALVTTCAGFGVAVIPEIDTPAHSLALTSAFPDLGLSGRPDAVDMLDCSNPEALTLACRVWDEQLSGAFADTTTIQIGGDEYYGQADDFVNYEAGLIEHLSTSGKTLRMWGSLTALLGETRISPYLALTESVKNNIEYGILQAEQIQMQLWSTYWADPLTMYRAGFDLINSSSDRLYINCGEATDYLDKESLYNTYRRTTYTMTDGTTETLPSWSPRVIGSSAALWNDLIDNLEIGISEYDMTDRVLDAMPVLAEVFWQENGTRGQENGTRDLESGTRDRDSTRTYEEFAETAEVLRVAPDADPLHQRDDLLLGPDYAVSFEVYLPSGAEGDDGDCTIFAVDVDGNTYACKARQYDGGGSGQFGFSREFYDYAFDYTLPTDTWVQIKVVGELGRTTLYADGELVGTLGSTEAYEQHATFLFPTQVNEAFAGEVRNIHME